MDDLFSSIDEECGVISDSQEDFLSRSAFIGETRSDADARIEAEKNETLEISPGRKRNSTERSPDHRGKGKEPLVVPAKRVCGGHSSSPFRRCPPLKLLKDAIFDKERAEVNESEKEQKMEVEGGDGDTWASPSSLLDVVKLFSGRVERGVEKIDILEVAAMKGIDLRCPPRWWRPGGYDAKGETTVLNRKNL